MGANIDFGVHALLPEIMNYKGLKDQTFVCEECEIQFSRKNYGSENRFCSRKCFGSFSSRTKLDAHRITFSRGELTNRGTIYKLLVERDGDECSVCSITEWNGKPIRLWVDHIDGDATNNMPKNFRLICPNCDSQSDTFGARNKGNGRKSRGLPQYG